MASKTVEYIIKVRDFGSAAIRRIGEEFKAVGRVASAAGSAIVSAGKYAAAGITTAFAGIALTIREAFKVETALTQFGVLLGSAEKAKKVFADLKKFSDATPFTFEEVAQAGRMLLAFGEDSSTLLTTLRRLGDVASAVGMPFAELAEIYGKNRVQGRLMAQDVNQLTGRGIPVIGEFAKILGVSQDQVRGLVEAGQVDFKVLEQAIANLTGEGGRFAGMMDQLSLTGEGLFSTLRGEWSGALADFGKELMGLAKDAITAAINGLKKLREDGTLTTWAKNTNEALRLVKDTLASLFGGDTKTLQLSFDVVKAGVKDAFTAAIELLLKAAPAVGKLIGTAAELAFNVVKQKAWKAEATGQALAEMEEMGVKSRWGFRPAKGSGVTQSELQAGLEKRVSEILAKREGKALADAAAGSGGTGQSLPDAIAALRAHVTEPAATAPEPARVWDPTMFRSRSKAELEEARRSASARWRDANRSLSINPDPDPQVRATFEQIRADAAAEIIETSRALAAMMKAAVPTEAARKGEKDVKDASRKAAATPAGGPDLAGPPTLPGPGRSGFEALMEDMQGGFAGGRSQTRMAEAFRRRLGASFGGRLQKSGFWSSGNRNPEDRTARDQLSELQRINQTLTERLGMKP